MAFHGYVTPKGRQQIIDREQSSGPRPTLRQELNSSYTAQMMKARAVRGSRKPSDVAMFKRATEQMADLSEQLLLLDAIEFGLITPIVGGKMKLAKAAK
jgi:hypothetical protein